MEKIFIDTDDLRDVARHTKGAVHQLSDIKLDVLKAAPVLQNDPATSQAFNSVLAAIDAVGTAINTDYDALVQEVVGLEAEQGIDPLVTAAPLPAPAAPPPAGGGKSMVGASLLLMLAVKHWPNFAVSGSPQAAPQPWNEGWVTADGTMGTPMQTLSTKVEWGESWDARVETSVSGSSGIFSGRASAGASVDAAVGAEAEFGDKDGNIGASASAHAHVGADAHAEAEGNAGPLHGKAQADAHASLDAEAHAGVSAGKDGINANVGASAKAEASASASANADAGPAHAGANANASAEAHAEAGAQGHAGTDGVSGSYGAGAGASATAGAGVNAGVDGVGDAHYGVKGGVGVGVHAGGSGSLKTDDIGFDFNAELGIGLDLGIDFGIHINPEGIVKGAWDAITHPADTIGDAFDKAIDGVEAPFKAIDHLFSPSHDAPAAAAAPAASDLPNIPPVEQGGLFGGPGTTPPPTPPAAPISAGDLAAAHAGGLQVPHLDHVSGAVAGAHHVGGIHHLGHAPGSSVAPLGSDLGISFGTPHVAGIGSTGHVGGAVQVDGAGHVSFGDGVHGAQPAAGHAVVSGSAHGGGAAGNVGGHDLPVAKPEVAEGPVPHDVPLDGGTATPPPPPPLH